MKRYNQLYYCFRDGVVFDSESGQYFCPSELKEQHDELSSWKTPPRNSTEKEKLSGGDEHFYEKSRGGHLSQKELKKLTYNQWGAYKRFDYLLTPERAYEVRSMLGKYKTREAAEYCQEHGRKVIVA